VTSPFVVVLDYGSGNVHSAAKALEAAGARVELSADRTKVLEADGLVVPGVGAFAAVMERLGPVAGTELVDRRLAGGRPVLGICAGMQVFFDRGIEGGVTTEGLGQWPGTVTELEAPVLPHMGWNTVETAAGSVLFDGIAQERFYFVHSYAAREWSLEVTPSRPQPSLTWATHGSRFLAAVQEP
jgi:glutamine amidotransferase